MRKNDNLFGRVSHYSILFGVGIMVLVNSCSKQGPAGATGAQGATGATGAQGPSGPVLTGTITGYVILHDEYGDNVQTGLNSVFVHLYNAASNAEVDSVYANSSGQYTIPNVQTGIYSMITTYSGYGEAVHQNEEFNGGTLTVDNRLSQIPLFNVTTAMDSIRKKNNTVYIFGTITANTRFRTFIVFAGMTNSASSSPSTYSFITVGNVPADSTNYTVTIPVPTFYGHGFMSGTQAYFAVYGAATNYTDGDYTDFASGNLVYTAISPTAVNPPALVLP
jgi:hypothetical protein